MAKSSRGDHRGNQSPMGSSDMSTSLMSDPLSEYAKRPKFDQPTMTDAVDPTLRPKNEPGCCKLVCLTVICSLCCLPVPKD
ncbi:hypothetical protein LSAT2_001697 [Lamellibrachia satsuma]|nr:hypothetical protein LSAT2_001697 [Lamellibrachia satsuma]